MSNQSLVSRSIIDGKIMFPGSSLTIYYCQVPECRLNGIQVKKHKQNNSLMLVLLNAIQFIIVRIHKLRWETILSQYIVGKNSHVNTVTSHIAACEILLLVFKV